VHARHDPRGIDWGGIVIVRQFARGDRDEWRIGQFVAAEDARPQAAVERTDERAGRRDRDGREREGRVEGRL
jgi:hypothetical protein